MFSGLLPIGSVVLVGDSERRVMIVGVCQKGGGDEIKLWDYVGVLFPEGYLNAEKMYLFNNDQITRVYALGYQDEEQLAFKEKVDEIIVELRNEEQ